MALDQGGKGRPVFGLEETWVDPVVGARVALRLSDRWTATGLLDVGGLGAGSEISWQGLVKVSYRISGRLSADAGYRHLYFDRRGQSLRLEQSLGGPLVGVTLGF